MNEAGRRDRHVQVAERALTFFFLAIVATSGCRFYLLRHVLDFTDENDHTATGWLLTQGETLYGSIFSHHMPLPYLAAHVVALVFPMARPAHFRVVPWLAYLVVALLLVLSPIGRMNRSAGWFAGSAFLVLVSIALPPFWGHLLLMDNLAGCGLAVFVAFVSLPAILQIPCRGRDDLTGGLAAGLALMASPMAFFPLAAGILPLLTAESRTQARGGVLIPRLARLAGGVAVSILFVALWLYCFGSLRGFVTDVIVFNREAYAPFLGEKGTTTVRLLVSGLAGWVDPVRSPSSLDPAFPRRNILAFFLLAFGAVLATGLLAGRRRDPANGRSSRRHLMAGAAQLSLVLVLSRLRGFDFRALPFFLLAITSGALSGALLLTSERRRRDAVSAALLAAPLLAFSALHFTNRIDVPRAATSPPQLGLIADFIRAHTEPEERVAAFNIFPRLFLESRRRPATNALVYLPWQARWEALHPEEPTACEQLRTARPRFVFLDPWRIWGAIDWSSYAGCMDRFIRENYEPLHDPAFQGLLWERRPPDSVTPGRPD